MESQKESHYKTIIGMVDDDNPNRTPRYFDEFEIVKSENNIHLKKHKEYKQYLLVVCPVMEKWLLDVVSQNDIDLEKYHLPPNLDKFKKITKSLNLKDSPNFRDFLSAIQDAEPIQTLRQWLKDLKMNDL
ncbi:MAG: hypothetical protein H7Y04_01980 [Verrucomicrobia bacterium]|nr:hypothetical protein [Cytophagales bacterium]